MWATACEYERAMRMREVEGRPGAEVKGQLWDAAAGARVQPGLG